MKRQALLDALCEAARKFVSLEIVAPEGAGTNSDGLEKAAHAFVLGKTMTPGMLWADLFNALGEPDGVREPYPTYAELIDEVKQLRVERDRMKAERAFNDRVLGEVQRDANVALEQRREADARAAKLEEDLAYERNCTETWRANCAAVTKELNETRVRLGLMVEQRDAYLTKCQQLSNDSTTFAHKMLVDLRTVLGRCVSWPTALACVREMKAEKEALGDILLKLRDEHAKLRDQLERVYNGCGNMMSATRAALDGGS